MKAMQPVNLAEAFSRIDSHWQPHLAGAVNDCEVKLARLKGEFMWHQHDDTDEFFLVVKGELLMKLRTGDVTVKAGEFIIIPRGIEHLPVAREDTHVLLFEQKGTVNTGNEVNERTVETKTFD